MALEKFLPGSYTLYGLTISSNLPLPGLIARAELASVDLHFLLNQRAEFASRFGASPAIFFYTSPNSDRDGKPVLRMCALNDSEFIGFFYSDGVRFAVECEGREIWADWPDGYSLEDACTYLIGPVVAFALRLRGTTCLHASAIAVGDRAIALVGAPGAGKSTTAAAFAHLGFPVLSDDIAVLGDLGDRFQIQPGYPRINLWPDSVKALFGSPGALPRITPTWDKRYLPLDCDGRRFQATPLPLGTIYVLGERKDTLTPAIQEPLNASEAFMTLVANTYVNHLLDADMRSREFKVLKRVVSSVPVRRVAPASDPSKVFELCETIVADAGQSWIWDRSSNTSRGG